MDYANLLEKISALKVGDRFEAYSFSGEKIIIYRPEKLGKSLKNKDYKLTENFQIILKKENAQEFLPNHLRVMIDIDKIVRDHKNSSEFFQIIELIYNGEDPIKFEKQISSLNLSKGLDTPLITLCLIQLFMAEQDINYKDGNVQPPRAYLMGYLRFIQSGEENIDKILWSSTRHPPRQEFWKNFNN